MIRSAILAAAVLGAAALSAAAQSPVTAQNVWARATPPSASTGAIYLTLKSPAGDTLTGASTPLAASATVHEMSMANGVMRMRPVDGGLPLPAGQAVALQPGGYHIMLEGLKQPLKQGEDIPVHLTFKTAPPLDITAHVGPIGASGPQSANAGAMPGMAPDMKMPH